MVDYYGVPLCGPDGNVNPPPEISSAIVVGDTLTLRYSEALDTGSQPAIEDYEVSVNDLDERARGGRRLHRRLDGDAHA